MPRVHWLTRVVGVGAHPVTFLGAFVLIPWQILAV